MSVHGIGQSPAGRAAVAVLVLAATFIGCLWLGQYRQWVYNSGLNAGTQPVTPAWATPAAVAVGLAGAALVLLILRPHRSRR